MLMRTLTSPIVLGALLLMFIITAVVFETAAALVLTIGAIGLIGFALIEGGEKRVKLLILEQTSFRLISVEINGATWYRVERHVQFPYGWHVWRLEGDVYDTDEAASAFYDQCVEDLKETLQDLRARYTMGTNAKLLTSVRAGDLKRSGKRKDRITHAVAIGSGAGTPSMPPPPPRPPRGRRLNH